MVTQRRAPNAHRVRELFLWEGLEKATDIERHLIEEEKLPDAQRPDLKTIRRIVDELKALLGEPWSLSDGYLLGYGLPPLAVNAALEAMAAVVEETDGRRDYVTRNEVRWIARLRPAFPELPAWSIVSLSFQYLLRQAAAAPTRDLDRLLGFAPWRSATNRERYFHAVDVGLIGPDEVTLAFQAVMVPQRILGAFHTFLEAPGENDEDQAVMVVRRVKGTAQAPGEQDLWEWYSEVLARHVAQIPRTKQKREEVPYDG